jgi:hypothetical protein
MPRATGRTYSALRFAAPLFLIIHLGIRLIFPEPTIFADLFIYNLVALLAALNVLAAPRFNDYWAKIAIFVSLILWTLASTISTWNIFFKFNFPNYLTDILYAFFYPLIAFGIFRALTFNRKVISLELFDTLIIGLGATSVISSLLLKPAMLHFDGSAYTVFFSILYPVGDVVIVGVTVAIAAQQRINTRAAFLLIGSYCFCSERSLLSLDI